MPSTLRLAIDLGAGSGRAMVGRIAAAGVRLQQVHRFHYTPREAAGRLRWDFAALLDGVREGLRTAHRVAEAGGHRLESIGVDSWGVDYGLLDADGRLIEEPICYRDRRTSGVMEEVHARLGRGEVFSRTGIQCLPFNTLYQLAAHTRDGLPLPARRLLLIPDLCHHALCGSSVAERTNASTTQMVNLATDMWDTELLDRLGLPRALMPEIVHAGTDLGVLSPAESRALGIDGLRVIAPATHDTGSAVAGTPLRPGWAYISSGTWSLVGVERDAPLVNDAVARANFTNEAGACGTVRFLKNVMGLWILEACRREWAAAGISHDHAALASALGQVDGFPGFVFPDDPRFFNPKSMVGELRAALAETAQEPHDDPVLLTRVILDSLALRYASVIGTIEALTGQLVPGIHIVGGGSMNAYLNQATADAADRCVIAGPVEAAATGNLLLQAIACSEIPSLEAARRLLASGVELQHVRPRSPDAWRAAAHRYRDVEGQALS